MDRAPTLLLVAGLPGTGKSALALAIGRLKGWPVLDKDTIKSALLNLGADESLAGPASYDLLLDLASDLVRQGHSVILDAPAKYPVVLRRCEEIAASVGGSFRIILCQASSGVRERRMRQRVRRPSPWASPGDARPGDESRWDEVFPEHALRLDTSVPVPGLASRIVDWLDGRWPACG